MYFILLRPVFILCSLLLNSIFFVYAMEEETQPNINQKITFIKNIDLTELKKYISEKSLFFNVLNTNNNNTQLIYTPVQNENKATISIVQYDQNNAYTIENTYSCRLLAPVDSQLKNITTYAKYIEKKDSSYIFYVANHENVIYKVTFNIGRTPTLIATKLYEHNSPVAHMSLIYPTSIFSSRHNIKYLVTGSTYPSIKIYDLSGFKTVKTLHNGFLLGCVNESIIFAKKITRPSGGFFGRWIESWKKETPFDCMIYSIKAYENLKENAYVSISIKIIPNKYAIIAEDKLNLHVLNKEEINIIKNPLNQLIRKDIPTTNVRLHSQEPRIIISIKADNQTENLNYNTFKKKLQEILNTKEFGLYLKQYIMDPLTRENFIKTNPTNQNHESFVKYIIKHVLQNILVVTEETLNKGTDNILNYINTVQQELLRLTYNTDNYFSELSTKLTPDFFDNWGLLIFNTGKNKKNECLLKQIKFKETTQETVKYTFNNIKKLYAHENLIVIQENNTLFYTNSNDPEQHFYEFPIEFQEQEHIIHVLVHQNSIGVITNKRLLSFLIDQNT